MNDLVKGFLWTAGAVIAVVLADVARRRLAGADTVPAATQTTVIDDELIYLETTGAAQLELAAVTPRIPQWSERIFGIYPLPDRDAVSVAAPESSESLRELIDRYQRFGFGINPPRSRLPGVTGGSGGYGYVSPSGGATVTGGSPSGGGSSGWTFS